MPIIICSNDDPGVTLTYFTARSNLVTFAVLQEKVQKSNFLKLLQPVTLKMQILQPKKGGQCSLD